MRLPAHQQLIFIGRPAGSLDSLVVDDPHRSRPRFVGSYFRDPQGSNRRWPRIAPNDLQHDSLTSVRACNRTTALQGAGSLLCALRHRASVCRRCKAGRPTIIFQRMSYLTRLAGKKAATNCHMFVKGLSAVVDNRNENREPNRPVVSMYNRLLVQSSLIQSHLVQSYLCSIVSLFNRILDNDRPL